MREVNATRSEAGEALPRIVDSPDEGCSSLIEGREPTSEANDFRIGDEGEVGLEMDEVRVRSGDSSTLSAAASRSDETNR